VPDIILRDMIRCGDYSGRIGIIVLKSRATIFSDAAETSSLTKATSIHWR